MTALEPGDYLDHIAAALANITTYVDGLDEADFRADQRTIDAVILNLHTLGEAARQIRQSFPEFAAAHSALPWQQMAAMRNRLAHGYFDIDLTVVWNTVRDDVPELSAAIDALPIRRT